MSRTRSRPTALPHRTARLRGAVAATLGLAVLATGAAACSSGSGDSGGGPAGKTSAAPSELVPKGSPAPANDARPNIVTIVTDDMRTDDLRFMPNVRRLVQDQGLEFTNSFAPNPLCAPARSSLLTGSYSHNTAVMSVKPPSSFGAFDDRESVATAMNRAGYNTLFLGKYLNGYGIEDSKVTGSNSFRYVPPGWTDWWGSVDRPADSGYAAGGTYSYYHAIFNHDGTIEDRFKGRYQTVAEGRIARRLVTTYHRSPKPFFLYFAPIAPHFGAPREPGDPAGLTWPRTGKAERFKTPARPQRVRGIFDGRVTTPPGLPVSGPADTARQMRGLPRPMDALPPISSQERAAMLSVTRQRGEALYVLDQQVARLVRTLKDTGEYADTVLMFTSDNGYFLGEHRMRQGKIWTHEPSLRVPFLVTGPGVRHGSTPDPITSPDIGATVMDLGGARSTRPVDGVSVVPSFSRDRGWRVPVVLENVLGISALRQAAAKQPDVFPRGATASGVRTARWTYVRYADGDGELYDLDRDPNQLHNLYGAPRYAAVRARLTTLWAERRDCRGSTCTALLPPELQLGPGALRASTRLQRQGVEARYGVPAL